MLATDRGSMGEGDALRTLSRLLFFVGRVHEGEPLASKAVELLERLPPGHELAMAYGNVSQRGMAMHDLDRAVVVGHSRARARTMSLDDNEALAYSLTNIGTGEFQAGLGEGQRSRSGRSSLPRGTALRTTPGELS